MTIHQTTIRPAVTAAEQRYLNLYAALSERLPGARFAPVRAWRESALDAFTMLGVPHRRVEEWKYTDLRMLMPEVHALAGLSDEPAADVSLEGAIGKQLAHLEAYRAVFINGRFRQDLSNVQDVPGVTFEPLRQALEDEAAAAQTIANLSVKPNNFTAALSTAFATDGAVIAVAPGAKLDKPVHCIFLTSDDLPHLSVLRHAMSIGEGAEACLIETHAAGGLSQAISKTRLAVGARASLKHVRLFTGDASKQLAAAAVTIGRGAHYEPLQLAVNGALVRFEATIRFEGPDAQCHYTAAMILRGHSLADFTLVADHAAPNCVSRELVKAVLDGRARGVFQGKVIVQRGAQKTDGKQMAKALLLSDDAEFDSKPELEIFADDVVCGHGSTAGQLDEDMLFYLRARGIPEAEARSLLIAAFIGETLDKIDNEALRSALDERVAAWLTGDPNAVDPAI
jgi:Fe-S cluster assembly protein SufD